jgi:hypothetical protein
MLGKQRAHDLLALRDRVLAHQRGEDPARQHPRPHRGHAEVKRGQQRRARIGALRARQFQVLARRGIEHEKLLAAVKLRRSQAALAVGNAGAFDKRVERVERAMDRLRFLDRKAVEVRPLAGLDHFEPQRSGTRAQTLDRAGYERLHRRGHVGDDLGRRDALELGQ